jgi:hypothetical protein
VSTADLPPALESGSRVSSTQQASGAPTELCAFAGFSYTNQAFVQGDQTPNGRAPDLDACAMWCTKRISCTAATFRRYVQPGQPNCLFHSFTDRGADGVVVPAATDKYDVVIIRRPCAAVHFVGQLARPASSPPVQGVVLWCT